MRWNWKHWQALVREKTTDADALKLAEVWPGFAKGQHGKRGMWAHEMTYKTLKGWDMSRVMHAANILEAVGLSSRCPGTPLYVPLMPETSPPV
jgi:hypothetical protein